MQPIAKRGVPTQYPVAADESVTVQLVRALADAADVDPVDLSPPLYDVVDPDALEALFAPTEGGATRAGRVEFAYADYRVTVSAPSASDREATITVADADGDPSGPRSAEQEPGRIHGRGDSTRRSRRLSDEVR